MEGERHDTKRQGEADGERSAEEAMVEGRDGRTKEGRGGRAARTGREQTAPAGHFEAFAKNASYMGGLREGWIEKHSNKEEATVGLCQIFRNFFRNIEGPQQTTSFMFRNIPKNIEGR